jgi:hypothetical protein
MSRAKAHGNDLIIGMTLAEVFLLLLVVGWYGSRLESEATGRDLGTPVEILQKQLDDAKDALRLEQQKDDQLEKRIQNLEATLDWLGGYVRWSGQPIRDIPSATAALNAYTAGLKRGKPTCEAANVLVQVVEDEDKLALTVLQPFVVGSVTFSAQQTLTEKQDVDRFFQAIEKYYSDRHEARRDCAFDFKLDWRTDRDYRTAKKLFDPYFYPAGDRRLQ